MEDSDDDKLYSNSEQNYKGAYYDHLLEQYKTYVEMTDRVTERRIKSNTFFLSANSFLLSALGILAEFKFLQDFEIRWLFIATIGGIVFSLAWLFLVQSYRQLNSSKFEVIHSIEKKLPIAPYTQEWKILGSGQNRKKYMELTNIEKIVPAVFTSLYLILTLGLLIPMIIHN